MFASRIHLEAVLAKTLNGLLEIRDHDGGVAVRGDRRGLVAFEMDLSALAFDPNEGLGQCGRRLDPFESEQPPELERAPDLLWSNLERDVMEHRSRIGGAQSSSEPRAARTTIAVDQVTASAVISMSRP
jgi:hypothetical protein